MGTTKTQADEENVHKEMKEFRRRLLRNFVGIIIFLLVLYGVLKCIFYFRTKISGNHESAWKECITMGGAVHEIEVMDEQDEQQGNNPAEGSSNTILIYFV